MPRSKSRVQIPFPAPFFFRAPETATPFRGPRRHSQVVRQRPAKPLFASSNLAAASKVIQRACKGYCDLASLFLFRPERPAVAEEYACKPDPAHGAGSSREWLGPAANPDRREAISSPRPRFRAPSKRMRSGSLLVADLGTRSQRPGGGWNPPGPSMTVDNLPELYQKINDLPCPS